MVNDLVTAVTAGTGEAGDVINRRYKDKAAYCAAHSPTPNSPPSTVT
ncbi:hypothetical protein [Streptomyces sp. cg2]